jgi:hypothetical protein
MSDLPQRLCFAIRVFYAVLGGSPRARFAIKYDVRVTIEKATADSAHIKM